MHTRYDDTVVANTNTNTRYNARIRTILAHLTAAHTVAGNRTQSRSTQLARRLPMRILTINAGSSSIKVALYEWTSDDAMPRELTSQNLPQGEDPTTTLTRYIEHVDEDIEKERNPVKSTASSSVSSSSSSPSNSTRIPIRLIVHRIVHGGSLFHAPTLLTSEVMKSLEQLNSLAPLHNPPAIKWIKTAKEACGDATSEKEAENSSSSSSSRSPAHHIGIFDTSFFHSLPIVSRTYALPQSLCEKLEIRRYGFHGIAHEAMMTVMGERSRLKSKKGGRLITMQLGSGASIAALLDGRPIDTSMGFTPLEGLVMATRCGDVDPGVTTYIQEHEPKYKDPSQLEKMLNHDCGLVGLSGGESNDMKAIEESSSESAKLAREVFEHRLVKYIGAYIAELGGLDTIVFGGGIGEHGAALRERVITRLAKFLPISFDVQTNRSATKETTLLSSPSSAIEVWMVKVDEGAVMVRDAIKMMPPK